MRTFIFLLCTTVFSFTTENAFSQEKVNIDQDQLITVDQVFKIIKEQTNYRFIYPKKAFKDSPKVQLTKGEILVTDLLEQTLSESHVGFELAENNTIIINSGTKDTTKSSIQENLISGIVADKDGEPLPGVSVIEKGTINGTTTDFDGNYSLKLTTENPTLVISSMGYTTAEQVVDGQSSLNITLQDSQESLEEVLVVGYGTMRKSDLTGAVSSVDVQYMTEMPNVSLIQGMQGTVAGLNVGAVDAAGEDPNLSIRGQNTLSSDNKDNAPLIVVDGIIYRGSLVDLNTADIESVTILKDASSAAIYGSQASNGVMLITTKIGKHEQKPTVSYSGSYSIQTPSSGSMKPMGRDELTNIIKDAYWKNGSRIGPDYLEEDPNFDLGVRLATQEMAEGFENGTNNDMWDMLTQNGFINNQNVSVRGKSNDVAYFFSGGMTDVEGFMANDEYKKYNYRINLNTKINSWLKVGMETFLTSSDYSGVSVNNNKAFNMHPWSPLYDENGELLTLVQKGDLNPLLQVGIDDSDKRMNLFGTFHADIKLPIKGLNYRVNFSQNYRTKNHNQYDKYYMYNEENPGVPHGTGFKKSSINYSYTFDNILTYKNTFNDVHSINATFVYGVEKREISSTDAIASLFQDDILGYNSLEQGDPTLREVYSKAEQEQSLYTMGRLVYGYDNKYLLTATVRRDGFSGFGTDTKMAVFPSIALGWVVTKERFMENVDVLNLLKIRGSYGQTGRRAVDRYDTHAIVKTSLEDKDIENQGVIFGDAGAFTKTQWTSQMANNDLGWETTTGLNFGLDFAMFNSRLSGTVEYYNNKTEDILYDIKIPNLNGFNEIRTNIGEFANNGLEVTLKGAVIQTKDFSWNASVNFSRNRNEIVSILGTDDDNDGIEDDLVENGLFIGQPRDVFYDYEITGIWQLADEEAAIIPTSFFPGGYKLADLSGPDGEPDGEISAADDRKVLGYKDPAYRIGLENIVSYKGFNLRIFLNTIQGGKNHYYGKDAIPEHTQLERFAYQNWPSGGWDYWMPENPNARFRRLDQASVYENNGDSNQYTQRNFIRLQDVSISYTFDAEWMKSMSMSKLKVFASGKNLATWTKWRGWDPETGRGFNTSGVPLMSSFTMGLNVEF